MIPSPNERLCLQRAFGPRSLANITPTRPDQASPASAPALRMALPHIARATWLPLTLFQRQPLFLGAFRQR